MSSNFNGNKEGVNTSAESTHRMLFHTRSRDAVKAKVTELNKPYADDHAKHGVVFYSKRIKTKDGKIYFVYHKRFSHKLEQLNGSAQKDGGHWRRRRVPGGYEVVPDIRKPDAQWEFVPDPVPASMRN